MAEAIADLHGFKDGVIVHGDIQLSQYLFSRDGQLKLNDFNRAEVLLWDTKKRDYCRYRVGLSYGNLRSPEEDEGEPLNEQIDVFSLGKEKAFLWKSKIHNVFRMRTGSYGSAFVQNLECAFKTPCRKQFL